MEQFKIGEIVRLISRPERGLFLLLRIVDANLDARNNRGETPLVLAVQQRHGAIVRQLVDAGANPAIADSVIGLNALDYAVRDGRSADIVEILQSAPTVTEEAPTIGPSAN